MRWILVSAIVLAMAALQGCASMKKAEPGAPEYAPVSPEIYQPQSASPGAIYQANYGLSLWSDSRARNIGDVLTVVLDESTDSSKSAKTEITKEDANEMSVTELLGTIPTLNGYEILSSDTENNREFAGESKSSQGNELTGNITVTVANVLPNGNLVIRGEKWITLTDGKEYIRLTGIVRPLDVTPDNRVSSSRIANAAIEYSGTGAGADANRVGWATRIFMSDWWPF